MSTHGNRRRGIGVAIAALLAAASVSALALAPATGTLASGWGIRQPGNNVAIRFGDTNVTHDAQWYLVREAGKPYMAGTDKNVWPVTEADRDRLKLLYNNKLLKVPDYTPGMARNYAFKPGDTLRFVRTVDVLFNPGKTPDGRTLDGTREIKDPYVQGRLDGIGVNSKSPAEARAWNAKYLDMITPQVRKDLVANSPDGKAYTLGPGDTAGKIPMPAPYSARHIWVTDFTFPVNDPDTGRPWTELPEIITYLAGHSIAYNTDFTDTDGK